MNQHPVLSLAGLWMTVPTSDLAAPTWGNVVDFSALVPLGNGRYGVAFDGWAFGSSATVPDQVNAFLLTPDATGALSDATSTAFPDAATWGAGSVLVGDFNGDGRSDIVFVAHNEQPYVSAPGTAYMSNADGTYTKVTLPGVTQAHDAEITTVAGQLAIITTTFDPAGTSPIFTYSQGQWVEHLPTLIPAWGGDASAVSTFGPNGAYEFVRSDISTGATAGTSQASRIYVFGFDPSKFDLTSPGQLQVITPYLSTLPQYANYPGGRGVGITHTYRLWVDDLNHDGKPDLLAGESMNNPDRNDFPSALQVLLNNGDGTFRDATATLNPDMPLDTFEEDYNPSFVDLDHSGINSYLFGSHPIYTSSLSFRQANYLLLNDGTGRLYIALHDQFATYNNAVLSYLDANYTQAQGYSINDGGFAKFIGVPQPDGSVNYISEYSVTKQLAVGQYQTVFVNINVPLSYNPTTDFTQDITINDRNGSTLMRTWAGNDVFHDTNSGPNAHIDGGLGTNTSIYSGTLSQYLLGTNSDGSVTVTSEASGVPQVNDTLVRIQTLTFADGALSTANLATVGGWVSSLLREGVSGAHAGLADQTAVALTSGADTQAQALQQILTAAQNTTSVATMAYEFFTQAAPSSAGMDYLVSPTGPNPNNLNAAYYQLFNVTNRFINFAVNLGKVGAGEAWFQAHYGSLSLTDATSQAYATIFGTTPTAAKVQVLLTPVVETLNGVNLTRADYFATYGGDGLTGLGTKAAMVGWLLAQAVLSDLGTYAKSNDAFLTDVALHGASYGVDIIGHYAQAGFAYTGG